MKRNITVLLLLTAFTGISDILIAQDRHFSWTYESTTLPKGGIDIEPWVSFYSGREHFYNKYQTRLEFETGLTDRLQTALYFNSKHETMALTDSLNNITGLKKSSAYSFSNEWKLNILNPSTAPIGLGLYAEYGISPDEVELEFKLILDKKTPKSIFAYNLVNEFEFEYEYEKKQDGKAEVETEKEYIIENDLAYMYMFKPTFGLGLEARNHNVFVEGKMEHSAVFLGPTLFFSQKNFFAILNILPQVTNLKGGGLDLHEYERLSARIILGISL